MPDTSGGGQRYTAAERRAQVVALRRRRLTFDQIGRAVGITRQNAWKIYQEALAAAPAPHVDEHRAEELMLIDDAIADLLKIARDHGKPRTAVEAWSSIRGWAERKARLLGLDAPARFEHLTLDAIDAELRTLKAEMGELPPEVPERHPG